ncbi:hypothetical protein LTR56_013306 [Elasticomyces elasticus]|nr:hypothetical protein LTR56_013306 [Elasticomyces elasticus]KAK3668438.1 hypothetical protein LTR22_000731 [Elasticomyces elasticus]KAK4930873.1 hypothetical protein LTR49_002638 [Elasticomyces elasticus]KAK5753676.1 hypothetical protein LTS12_016201 [Elasticomyces elasticus]
MSTAANIATGLRWLGMPAFLAVATIGAPLVAVAIPFVMLPTLGLLYTRRRLPESKQADLDALTYIYLGSGTIGIAAVLLGQLALVWAITKPLFGNQADMYFEEFARTTIKDLAPEQIALRARLASSWRHWVFLIAMTYCTAGFVEELFKYGLIEILRRQHRLVSQKAIPKELYVQYAVAAALGFCTMENIAFTRIAVQAGESGWKLALTIFERIWIGSPGHCLTAALLAINVARLGDYQTTPRNLWRILGGPIFWHGTVDFILIAVSSLEGNVGWIHPERPWVVVSGFALVECIQLALLWQVQRAWRSLGE